MLAVLSLFNSLFHIPKFLFDLGYFQLGENIVGGKIGKNGVGVRFFAGAQGGSMHTIDSGFSASPIRKYVSNWIEKYK